MTFQEHIGAISSMHRNQVDLIEQLRGENEYLLRMIETLNSKAPFVSKESVSLENPDLILAHRLFETAPVASFSQGSYASAFGRTVFQWYTGLLILYLSTGDQRIISKLELTMNAYEPLIRIPPELFLEVHESLFVALLSLHTLVMHSHKREFQKWLDIIAARYPQGIQQAENNHTHNFAGSALANACMFSLTKDSQYKVRLDEIVKMFKDDRFMLPNGAFDYNQRMPLKYDVNGNVMNALPIPYELNYWRYIVMICVLLMELGIELIPMQLFGNTIAIRTFLGSNRVAFHLDGSLSSEGRYYDFGKWRDSMLCLLAFWNADIAKHNAEVKKGGDSKFLVMERLYSQWKSRESLLWTA